MRLLYVDFVLFLTDGASIIRDSDQRDSGHPDQQTTKSTHRVSDECHDGIKMRQRRMSSLKRHATFVHRLCSVSRYEIIDHSSESVERASIPNSRTSSSL
jgi:hypothetical protein